MRRIVLWLSSTCTVILRKYLPDPLVIVFLLTAAVFLAGILLEERTPVQMAEYWGQGFWSLLSFTAQMATMLTGGFALAKAPAVDRCINRLVAQVHTPKAAVFTASLVGCVGCYLNWGFGLIVGALVARKLAMRIKGTHYPLLMAAAYGGFCVYGTGFTATIPVLIATPGHFLEASMGVIPLGQTLFAWPILVTAIILMVSLPVISVFLLPRSSDPVYDLAEKETPVHAPYAQPLADQLQQTFAEKLSNSRILGISIGSSALVYLVYSFSKGNDFNLNSINFFILFLGMLLTGTPARYIASINEGVKTVGGILLQYPFYAGLMAMMRDSGLVETMAGWFVMIADAQTLPFWGLISSFFINFFAPSAGGHWVIQGPFMIAAAEALQADMAKTAMSVMLGSAWNDLVQPFWLLPTLAISGLRLSDIMGYTVIYALWVGVVMGSIVFYWGYL